MTDDSTPVAVVGAGNMGANHARVYDELPGSDLVELVEPDPERAARLREEYAVPVHDRIDAISEATAATISVPNDQHRSVAETCLDMGLDVLVEKPLATTVDDAEAIVDRAERRDAVLQAGHIERFNPAVVTLREILTEQSPVAIEAHRLGPYNEQLSHESVVFDLMIHDLDIIDMLTDAPLKEFDAMGITPRSTAVDHAVGQLQFEDGTLGTATASHITHGKVRTLTVTTEQAFIELDYQEQDITVQRRGTEETTTLLGHSGYRTEVITESPYVGTKEPLKNELEHFLDCVDSQTRPAVDGSVGIRGVELATTAASKISN